ncbi:hypothetical protein F4780DRAFT_52659 [Xylariomycetidae sp. FL0641]|nr:hypothetical protein F4780DRAFT_52659 [Xylariomycetidae sp. FL0641]
MDRAFDFHDFNDPDEDAVTRLRHLAGDYGPNDPAYWDDEWDEVDDDDEGWDSDDSFSHIPPQVYEDFEKEQKKYPRNPRDKVSRTPAGPMMSLHDTPRFIPQWDEQILGPAWRHQRGEWDFDNPPKPLLPNDENMADAFQYCEKCGLTWLVGHDKKGNHHPEHTAWDPEAKHVDIHRLEEHPQRSIIVYIHGAFLAEGETSKSMVKNPGGTGAFYGKGSQYNIAWPQTGKTGKYDRERAELEAALRVLLSIQNEVLINREEMLEEAQDAKQGKSRAPRKGELDLDEDEDDEDFVDLPFRVILVSDHAETVEKICKYQNESTMETVLAQVKAKARGGTANAKDDLYQELMHALTELEYECDVHVRWYCVPEELNKEATALARKALDGDFSGCAGPPTGH